MLFDGHHYSSYAVALRMPQFRRIASVDSSDRKVPQYVYYMFAAQTPIGSGQARAYAAERGNVGKKRK